MSTHSAGKHIDHDLALNENVSPKNNLQYASKPTTLANSAMNTTLLNF